MLFEPYVHFHSLVGCSLGFNMFSKHKYMYLIVNLVFPATVFWSGNFFLIAPFPDHCLLVLLLHFHCSLMVLVTSAEDISGWMICRHFLVPSPYRRPVDIWYQQLGTKPGNSHTSYCSVREQILYVLVSCVMKIY